MTVGGFDSANSVLIVGAGIFGLGTAISIKKKFPTKEVTVVERLGIPAPDASSVDLNKVVRCDYGLDSLHTDLGNDAIRRFLEWNAEDEKRGRASVFHPCGVLVLSKDPLDAPSSKYEMASRAAMFTNGLGSYVVDGVVDPANKDVLPQAWHSAVHGQGDYKGGYLNKWCGLGLAEKTVARMADEATDLGVRLLPNHPVQSFVYGVDGRVTGVKCLEPGAAEPKIISADYTVVCAGAWSPSLLPELSALLLPTAQSVVHYRLTDPQAHARFTEAGGFTVWFADVVRTGYYGFPVHDETGLVKIANHSPGYKLPKPETGPATFVTGGTIEDGQVPAGNSFTIPRKELHFIRDWVRRNLPELEEKGKVESTRICWYTDSFDGRFLICPHPTVAGLHIATGGSGHAFKFAPVIGDVILDSLMGVSNQYTEAYKWRTNPDPNWTAKWPALGDLASPSEFEGEIDAAKVEARKQSDLIRADKKNEVGSSGTDIWGLDNS
ncbi:FAD dependent oxidoreductase [Hyaloraphidium curvatum]|nr:FAD dependent oxidoreductase [Hyaloraphidium curvatum]